MASVNPKLSSNSDFSHSEANGVPRHLSKEEVLRNWNLVRVVHKLGINEQCIRFAEEHEMVAILKLCRTHRAPMQLTTSTNKTFGSWYCSKGNCRQKSKITRTQGTFFDNIKIDLVHVFYLIYAFAYKWSYETVINEDPYRNERDQCLGRTTISDWYSHCREVIVSYQLEKNNFEGKIGGQGKIVEVDELKFGKRSYNRGQDIEGRWAFGLIEDGSEELRLELCPGEIPTEEALIQLIQRHVKRGTTIHTNSWGIYDCLPEHGYIHKKVNRFDPDNPFVDQDDSHTHRNESQCKAIKRFFKKVHYNNIENFTDSAVEYLWRCQVTKSRKDPFMEVIKAISHVYKIY